MESILHKDCCYYSQKNGILKDTNITNDNIIIIIAYMYTDTNESEERTGSPNLQGSGPSSTKGG